MKNREITWTTRYSDTDEPDDKGRWARVGYLVVDDTIRTEVVWISRATTPAGEVKYTFQPRFPANPKVLDSEQEAKAYAEEEFQNFLSKCIVELKFDTPTIVSDIDVKPGKVIKEEIDYVRTAPQLMYVDDKIYIEGDFDFRITPNTVFFNGIHTPIRQINFGWSVDCPTDIPYEDAYEMMGEKLKNDFINFSKRFKIE